MPYRVEQIEPSKTVMIVVDMQNDFGRASFRASGGNGTEASGDADVLP